jgi:hypothetical protein
MRRPVAPPAVVVLVPVKAFHLAKARLAGVLNRDERAALARRMAGIVLRAAHPLPVAVVCDDEVVAAWATEHGATVLWRPGRGLNPAVQEAVAALGVAGYGRVDFRVTSDGEVVFLEMNPLPSLTLASGHDELYRAAAQIGHPPRALLAAVLDAALPRGQPLPVCA